MHDRWNAGMRLVVGGALVAAAGFLSGCMSSPTYGTDKTANEQLASDVSNIFSINNKKRAPIDYSPRPELVKPAKGDTALPAPQESVIAAGNPDWPESPEQRLARVRADADANADNPNYSSPVVSDVAVAQKDNFKKTGESWRNFEADNESPQDQAAKSAEFKRRLKESQQGDPTKRKFLSEPPTDYRQASANAPTGDVGEDEYRKERRLKRLARKNRGWEWDDINPF